MRRNLRSMAHGASRGAWVELSAHLVHSLPGLQHHESSARWPGKKPHQRQGRYTKGHGGLDACDLQGFICFTGQPDSAHGHWVHSNSCAICQLWVRKRCPPKLFLRSHLLLLRKANARSSQQPGTLDSGPRQTAADKGERPAERAASCDATRAIAETGVLPDLPKKESLSRRVTSMLLFALYVRTRNLLIVKPRSCACPLQNAVLSKQRRLAWIPQIRFSPVRGVLAASLSFLFCPLFSSHFSFCLGGKRVLACSPLCLRCFGCARLSIFLSALLLLFFPPVSLKSLLFPPALLPLPEARLAGAGLGCAGGLVCPCHFFFVLFLGNFGSFYL